MIDFTRDEYGFWCQVAPEPIKYDEEYKAVQKTTKEMSWLRIGTLVGALDKNVAELSDWWVCDVGSGNGIFAKEAAKVFGNVREYDLSGSSISAEELYSREWDIIFLTDVLEHYEDISDLFHIKSKYIFLSFPETPKVTDWAELKGWRHYRPNEHIWMLNKDGVVRWLEDNGKRVIYTGNPEDAIRKSPYNVNISTVICEAKQV